MIRFDCCEHCAEVGGTAYCDAGHLYPCHDDCPQGNQIRDGI